MKHKCIITLLGGMLMGTAGIAILSGKDAKKAYTHCTAAVLRGKDSVMKTVALVRENCEDIYSDAVDINEKRYEEEVRKEVLRAKAIIEQYEGSCDEDISVEPEYNTDPKIV